MTTTELLIAALIVAAAVVAQAGTGSGFGIVSSPLLLMISPQLVPGPLLLVSMVASVLTGLTGFGIPQNRFSLFTAGLIGGVLGTVASTSGPPLVVVYRSEDPARYRANLSLFFLVSSLVSLLALVGAGSFGTEELLLTGWLLPGVALGALASRPVVKRISAAAIRPAALSLCLVAGVSLLVKGALA